MLLRGATDEKADGSHGYRVQLSAKYQELALVRFPEGGYVRTVPCGVKANDPMRLVARIAGNVIRVFVNGREMIVYHDRLDPSLPAGRAALGVSSNARVRFSQVAIAPIAAEPGRTTSPHQPKFTTRRWLGGRTFVFDDDEPILQLHHEADPSCFAKLMPGDKPRLTFDSHWGLENQGAFPEAKVAWTAPVVSGEGDSVRARWSAKHLAGRFVTNSELVVGFDAKRGSYTYEIDSELEMLAGEPFHFRYGFDFEHHTPLDPFRWKYLLIRDGGGAIRYRPLAPFDPGTLDDIDASEGLRVWHGRTSADQRVSPAVEYKIPPQWRRFDDPNGNSQWRPLNTAVCAAFYDTGVAFAPATLEAGDKLRVRYRYTGYPAAETVALFASAKVQENPRIDPNHHFVFAGDQWPTIRFTNAIAMDKPWWGNRPFLSGHNARPSYGWGVEGEQPVLKLGPLAYALAPIGKTLTDTDHDKADLKMPTRYVVSARVKSKNTHGPGGRIELLALKKFDPDGNGYLRSDPGNIAGESTRYFGNGSFDWRDVVFVAEVPPDATGLALGLGNGGTGEVLVSEVTVEPLGDKPPPVETAVASAPSDDATFPEAIWDLRMRESQGLYVFNNGASTHRTLELANVDWVDDDGLTAIRFADNPTDRADLPPLGILDQHLRHPNHRANYAPVRHVANAIGGGPHQQVDISNGLTLAAWVKPTVEMGKAHYAGKGDIIGFGNRRAILSLAGQSAPYTLEGRINVNEKVESRKKLDAGRWYFVAMTCKPDGDRHRVRLLVDGEAVGEGDVKGLAVEKSIADSIVLGTEIYYLHGAYYRGLIGRVLVVHGVVDDGILRGIARQR